MHQILFVATCNKQLTWFRRHVNIFNNKGVGLEFMKQKVAMFILPFLH
jgi:hypothetical protein